MPAAAAEVAAAANAVALDEFAVEFAGAAGGFTRGRLASMWNVRFETHPPVRSVRTFKGQRNFDGLWWSASTRSHVGFESWLEREQLMMLDFDPDIVAVSSQPFWLHWSQAGEARRHAPDFFARRADGCGLVVDVRPDRLIAARDAEAFAATARACATVGWRYRRVGQLDPVRAANVRWLAGYRHPRCFDQRRADALLRAFATPCPLTVGVAMVGDPIAVRPVAFHLLWTGALATDLHTRVLSADSMVWAASGGSS